jgi:hypothetical protein
VSTTLRVMSCREQVYHEGGVGTVGNVKTTYIVFGVVRRDESLDVPERLGLEVTSIRPMLGGGDRMYAGGGETLFQSALSYRTRRSPLTRLVHPEGCHKSSLVQAPAQTSRIQLSSLGRG